MQGGTRRALGGPGSACTLGHPLGGRCDWMDPTPRLMGSQGGTLQQSQQAAVPLQTDGGLDEAVRFLLVRYKGGQKTRLTGPAEGVLAPVVRAGRGQCGPGCRPTGRAGLPFPRENLPCSPPVVWKRPGPSGAEGGGRRVVLIRPGATPPLPRHRPLRRFRGRASGPRRHRSVLHETMASLFDRPGRPSGRRTPARPRAERKAAGPVLTPPWWRLPLARGPRA